MNQKLAIGGIIVKVMPLQTFSVRTTSVVLDFFHSLNFAAEAQQKSLSSRWKNEAEEGVSIHTFLSLSLSSFHDLLFDLILDLKESCS